MDKYLRGKFLNSLTNSNEPSTSGAVKKNRRFGKESVTKTTFDMDFRVVIKKRHSNQNASFAEKYYLTKQWYPVNCFAI